MHLSNNNVDSCFEISPYYTFHEITFTVFSPHFKNDKKHSKNAFINLQYDNLSHNNGFNYQFLKYNFAQKLIVFQMSINDLNFETCIF